MRRLICIHSEGAQSTQIVLSREIYRNLDYSVADLEAAAGGHIAISDDKSTVIMARMRNPSLSIHGIEGAFSGVGAKTVIPAKVGGRFSLRLVPPQQPKDIGVKVENYLNEEFAKLNTKCTLKVEYGHGGKPWVADHKHWNYQAAKNATEVSSRHFLKICMPIRALAFSISATS